MQPEARVQAPMHTSADTATADSAPGCASVVVVGEGERRSRGSSKAVGIGTGSAPWHVQETRAGRVFRDRHPTLSRLCPPTSVPDTLASPPVGS